jgi:hypothetical protein
MDIVDHILIFIMAGCVIGYLILEFWPSSSKTLLAPCEGMTNLYDTSQCDATACQTWINSFTPDSTPYIGNGSGTPCQYCTGCLVIGQSTP